MSARNSRRALAGCQAVLAAAICLAAVAAQGTEGGSDRVTNAAKELRRLRKACLGYTGDKLYKLLDTMTLRATELYEVEKYDAALDTILLAAALYSKDDPRTYYGVKQDAARIAVRWPTGKEAPLLLLDPRKYRWAMVAITNLDAAALDVSSVSVTVQTADAPTATVLKSFPPEDPEMRLVLKARAGILRPPPLVVRGRLERKIPTHKSVTFPVVFPAVKSWTELRLRNEPGTLDVRVRNYAAMTAHEQRYWSARRRARAYFEALARRKPPKLKDPPRDKPPKESPYVLIGHITNCTSKEERAYGIDLKGGELARAHREFYIRKDDQTVATLQRRRGSSGRIAQLISKDYVPQKDDPVYVRRKPK